MARLQLEKYKTLSNKGTDMSGKLIFWFVTPCSLVVVINLKEESVGFIIRVELQRRNVSPPFSDLIFNYVNPEDGDD
jgi:hypothetical protein